MRGPEPAVSFAPRLVALALVLATPVLAGCFASDAVEEATSEDPVPRVLGEVTKVIYDTILREEFTIEGAESTRLWVDVYRPETPDDVKVPVILVMTPYQSLGDVFNAMPGGGCDEIPPQNCPYDTDLVDFFVLRGYAVAFSDVRGNHNSGGCIDQTGPQQWQDGFATVEFLAEQPWSNGRVGMYGISYDGETQQSTAITRPPHLATIVPVASVASQYDYVYFEGVPYSGQGIGTMAGYFAISLVPGQDPGMIPTYPERVMCQAENFQAGADTSGDMTPYWTDRNYRLHAGEINTSVLHIHGLMDWNVKPIHIDGWFNELVNASVKRGIYGQWPHAFPNRPDWWGEGGILHRWMDHFLHGIDTGILDELPPVLIEDTDEKWRGIESFPPLEQEKVRLHLTTDGKLASEPGPAGEGRIEDKRRVDVLGVAPPAEGTALVFESEPFTAPVRLTGVPRLLFNATTDATSTHWAAKIEIVPASGAAVWMNRGYQDTRHLAGLDKPADLAPGTEYAVNLKMFPQDDVIPAGAKLRLTLANVDDWVDQDSTYATSVVKLGEGGAVLVLPLDPGGQEYPEDKLAKWEPRS